MTLYAALLPMTLFSLASFYVASRRSQKLYIPLIGVFSLYLCWLEFIASAVLSAVAASSMCMAGFLVFRYIDSAKVSEAMKFLPVHVKRLRQPIAGIILVVAVLAGFAVGLKVLPGGTSWILHSPIRLGAAHIDWQWKVKLFNALLGLGLICTFYRPVRMQSKGILMVFAVVVSVLSLALVVGTWQNSWQWDPKYHELLPWFSVLMLSFTVIPEEAFFHYCIQEPLRKHFGIASLYIVAILFGAAHLGGGLVYAGMATVAGFGYAIIWHYYKDILLCCACHWLVNIGHFTLLTYPY